MACGGGGSNQESEVKYNCPNIETFFSVKMPITHSLAVGLNKGHKVAKNTRTARPARNKGVSKPACVSHLSCKVFS